MVLYIDTREFEQAILALADGDFKVVNSKVLCLDSKRRGQFLKAVNNFLRCEKVSIHDVAAVVVEKGPGAFSALRTGIIVANTLAFSLSIPVVGVSSVSSDIKTSLQKARIQISKALPPSFVIPDYGREPTITKPKRRVVY